jgi:hypothetical protein
MMITGSNLLTSQFVLLAMASKLDITTTIWLTEMLIVAQLVKQFHAFYGTQKFITIFNTVPKQLSVFTVMLIHFTLSQDISLR